MRRASSAGQCSVPLLVAALLSPPGLAAAHGVDGDSSDWSTRSPGVANLALVVRDAAGGGELVWRDATGDARTDLASPELAADIVAFQVSGDETNLYLLVRRAPGADGPGQQVQVQVALDLDGVMDSGQTFFAGFSELEVAGGARWEYLARTRFGSGAAGQLFDQAWTATAIPAAQGQDVELAVPWTALGLAGPPPTPIRLSVATFRGDANDETVEVPGSDALDVVSDGGDPRASGFDNTWTEVQDGVLDHALEVHFRPDGQVHAPLVVDRFVSDASVGGSGEWYAVRNATDATLSLAGYGLGDEETPDGVEGMFTFPAGLSLAPGAVLVVARTGAAYQAAFGRAPDAELPPGSLPAVPDLVPLLAWAPSAALQLGDGGDQLMVLGPARTVLDVATWGDGTWAGVAPFPAVPGADRVLARAGAADTDDCAADFVDAGAQCASDAACGSACLSCELNACVPAAEATPCADGDLCNGDERCDAAGACLPGPTLTCDDGNPCTVDGCAPATGCGVAFYSPTTTTCTDGNACTSGDHCSGTSGACVSGPPLACDDGQYCTVDSCDPASGCVHSNRAQATACDDGNACTGVDVCNSSGACVGITTVVCDDGRVCTTDTCLPISGCSYEARPSGASCLDGDVCNGAETCDGTGSCLAGAPVVCDDGNTCNGAETCSSEIGCQAGTALSCEDLDACTIDVCDPASGCEHPPKNCSDGDACTADACNPATGACSFSALSCDDGDACTVDACDPATGCAHQPVVCDDGLACNGLETCSSVTGCQAGTPPTCDDGNPCTTDACDDASGCTFQARPLDSPCSDGNACNGAESCDGAGACRPGSTLACNDGNACTSDTCDPATGCAFPPTAAGSSCADVDACDGDESCDGAGACLDGTPLVCEDANPCLAAACDPILGCTTTPVNAGISCADADACNGLEACDGAGSCLPGAPLACDDSSPCTANACDPATGCTSTPVGAGISCSDGNACNGLEACDGAGACLAGAALACDDGNPCTANACDPATGCTSTPVGAGISCSDGNACNGLEACDGAGTCAPGTALACADGNACTADTCDPATGCAFPPVSAGSSCSDGNACNGTEACDGAGTCAPGTTLACADGNACTADTCDPATGCAFPPVNAGVSCSDGDACNGLEACDGAGTCADGTPPVCETANPCLSAACDPILGCTTTPVDASTSCADGDACNGLEACDGAGTCLAGTALACDDGNPCTADTCDPAAGCASSAVTDGTGCSAECGDGTCAAGACVCEEDPPPADDPGGCGCTTDGGGGSASLLLLAMTALALLPARPRRARVTVPGSARSARRPRHPSAADPAGYPADA